MFTENLDQFKIQQSELHRRAAHHRLVKSLQKPRAPLAGISNAVGSALILVGQKMVSRTQAAH